MNLAQRAVIGAMWPRRVVALVALAVPLMSAAGNSSPRFLALGDSYTIGEGMSAGQRWPNQLAVKLRKRGIDIAEAEIVARTGWTTDELSAAMDAHAFTPPYALVTLQIGVNNQYRGREVENFRSEFQRLLERAIELAGGRPQHVIVVSIPDWGVTRFGGESGRDRHEIARRIDAYNAVCKSGAAALNTRYVDVTAASRQAGDSDAMLAPDGLHPSAAMYALWVSAILPQAQAALTTR